MTHASHRLLQLPSLALLALLLLAACGGGGGEGGSGGSGSGGGNLGGLTYTPGVFPASSTFANRCQTPRTGTNPATGQRYPDVSGTTLQEKYFLRSWTNDLYLWYGEVADRDPASIADVEAYFDTLKTTAVLPSGRNKDEFHFTWDTAEYYALSQSGTSVGYGIAWDLVRASVPRQLIVQLVQPGTEAAVAGVGRGAEVLNVDGVDFVNENTQSGVNTINAGLFDPAQGSSHTIVFRDRGTGAQRSVRLTANAISMDPVPAVRVLPTSTGNVGYLLFNDHIATAEQRLSLAIDQLVAASVQDLVLDLRYNSGGYLYIAAELGHMVAGSARTSGKTFERLVFNSKHTVTNPVTGQRLQPEPFLSRAEGPALPAGQALPSLNLSRVYVLTTNETCSASESVINALRGVGVEVIQIGGDTCGKPFGFYPEDNCGTTYFSVQFQGVNEVGFGDYAAGFSPTVRAGQPAGATLPGCAAADDYAHDLGDPAERLLKVALDYRANGRSCALAASSEDPGTNRVRAAAASGGEGLSVTLPEEPWRNNRIFR